MWAFEKQASDHLGVEVNFVDFLGYSVQDKVEKERNDDRFENGRGQLGLADLGQLEGVAQLEAGVEEDALGVLCPGFAVVSGDAVALALTASFSGCWSWSLSLGRPDAVKVQALFDLCVIRLHDLLRPKIERLVNLQSINSELILINNEWIRPNLKLVQQRIIWLDLIFVYDPLLNCKLFEIHLTQNILLIRV